MFRQLPNYLGELLKFVFVYCLAIVICGCSSALNKSLHQGELPILEQNHTPYEVFDSAPDMHKQPARYLKIEYYQEAVSPLFLRILNLSPLIVESMALSSTLYDPDGNTIDQKEWTIKETIHSGEKSKPHLTPVTYHLPYGHKILTRILRVNVMSK